ncbi:MAG: hypothetical protein WCY49_07285 [Anaerovoracaceae bacterium]
MITNIEKHKYALKWYGNDAQMLMLVEEMAELTKEIMKTFRKGITPEVVQKLREEMADVQNCLIPLMIITETAPTDIEAIMQEKMLRTMERIAEDQAKNKGNVETLLQTIIKKQGGKL